jgi:DNA-binding MarR family transcriptional regulator
MDNSRPQIPGKLEDHVGYWLRKLSNEVSGSFAKRVETYGVSVANWVVLRILFDHDVLALKEIVTRVGVDQGALSRMIDRLVARGLVSRKESAHSRREVAISLTPEGRQLVPNLAREADENDRIFFSRLPKGRRQEFRAMIESLVAQAAPTGIPLD